MQAVWVQSLIGALSSHMLWVWPKLNFKNMYLLKNYLNSCLWEVTGRQEEGYCLALYSLWVYNEQASPFIKGEKSKIKYKNKWIKHNETLPREKIITLIHLKDAPQELGGPVVRTLPFHCRGPSSILGWRTKIPEAAEGGQANKKRCLSQLWTQMA